MVIVSQTDRFIPAKSMPKSWDGIPCTPTFKNPLSASIFDFIAMSSFTSQFAHTKRPCKKAACLVVAQTKKFPGRLSSSNGRLSCVSPCAALVGVKTNPGCYQKCQQAGLGNDTNLLTYHGEDLHFIHWCVNGKVLQHSGYGDPGRRYRIVVFRKLTEVDCICRNVNERLRHLSMTEHNGLAVIFTLPSFCPCSWKRRTLISWFLTADSNAWKNCAIDLSSEKHYFRGSRLSSPEEYFTYIAVHWECSQ